MAGIAQKGLGKRPTVYTDFDELLAKEDGLQAVDIVTDAARHHVIALKASLPRRSRTASPSFTSPLKQARPICTPQNLSRHSPIFSSY